MRPTVGTALGGRYRLDRLIAVGGMGEVWVSHDLSLRRDVAVKVLREEFAGDPGFLERFRTEARNAASLSHPNIAATHDYGEQSGSSYLVMELVAGEPLSDLLEREPVLPEQRLLPVLAQTARALHAAHQAGVVHRDVKPGNILLGPGGRVKITDFGVSTAPDQAPMTATGMVMGTAQYLSPEQAVGRPATASSDLYSLGIVAYESLVGHRPFTGPTAVDIAVAHVNDPVPPLPATVSRPVAELVLRLLAKDPADRPPSAAALARTLDALVGHTPPDGVPLGDDEPARAEFASPASAPLPPPASPAPSPGHPSPGHPSTGHPSTGWPSTGRPSGSPRSTRPSPVPPPSAPHAFPPPSFPPARQVPDPRGAPRPPAASRPDPAPARAPRDTARGTAAPAPGPSRTGTALRDDRRRPRSGASGSVPVRTSTTTGRRLGRLGRWSWPLVALVALLLALLVAALTDSVGGAGQGAAATAAASCPAPAVAAVLGPEVGPNRPGMPGASAVDGMISPCAPTGDSPRRHRTLNS